VDLPRLAEGNVAIQVFAIVTKSPMMLSHPTKPGERCVSARNFDVAGLLAALQGRPFLELHDRAIYQARRLRNVAERSLAGDGPELRVILDVDDLRRMIEDRRSGKQVIGAILALEGAHWVGDPDDGNERVEADMRDLFEAGVRLFAPSHRFDNFLTGSSEGCDRYGLTDQGRLALKVAQRLGMGVDLAHVSPQGMIDAMEVLEGPFTVSHTGIQAGCEAPCRPARNLSDEEIRLILRNEGMIGIGYWPHAIGPTVWRIGDAMEHIMGIARELGLPASRQIGLGSDYDGSVTPFFDASQVSILTTVLRRRERHFEERHIRNIAGLNACRFFARVLPGGSAEVAEEVCALAASDREIATSAE
jgi:microsomal dipeptidase-like Zn-dependent dipeptidase